MKQPKLRWVLAVVIALGLSQHGRADNLTNNFDNVVDYVANGIIGETNWDGVYLGFGDIPRGNVGGSGAGSSQAANSALAPTYLSVQTTGSDWSGNGDDGFYVWKVISGDFDVSVQSAPPWQSIGNNFAGLMVRAWNTNQSGAPVSFTSTNASENWLALFRAPEFGINEIREATNGANFENTFPDGATDTNTTRYLRITRTGDTFTFYFKTNATDGWTLITNASTGGGYNAASGTVTRPDWNAQPVQVGIAQAVFSAPGTPPVDFFTDFELSGPNVTAPPLPLMPAPPANLVTSSPNTNGSLTFSWTTNGGTGSILIIRKVSTSGVLVVNPVQGLTYASDTNFADPNTLVAGSTYVVYAGSATNATISGLGGSNNVYVAEVLSYDNSTGTNIYNTASPATLSFLGPGLPASISFSISPANIPLNGVGAADVIATFTTGEQVDVSSDPNVTLTSSDPTTISVLSSRALDGLQLGSATITASYAGFSAMNLVSVTPYRFTDNFSTSQDYYNAGLPGSTWDGIFDRRGDVVGNSGGTPIVTTDVDANITSNNVLTVTAAGTDWAGANDDGFLLFKNVTGDFQAQVHVTSIPRIVSTNANNGDGSVGYMFGGLLARDAASATENWVYWSEFDQFGDSTEARFAQNGVDNENPIFDGLTKTNYWLLMQRVNGTNFYFYRKVNATDPWEPHPEITIVQPNLTSGVPLQVGIFQATYTANSGVMQFDSFSLDADGLIASPPTNPPPAATNFSMTLNPNITMTLQWTVPGTNSDGTAFRSVVVMRAGAPVSAQPYLAFGLGGDVQNPSDPFGVPDDSMGAGNYVVYRSPFGATNLNQSVTVTGLNPGVKYYAAVYTFVGLGAQRTFNTATGATANSPSQNLVDGVLLGLQSRIWPPNGIPLGGVGIPEAFGEFTGGALVDITPSVTVTSDNTNILVVTNNILTPFTNGTASIEISYSGFTNVVNVTIRNGPSFSDNFGTSHDYLANGVAGTPYDGVYISTNVPDKTFASTATTATLDLDANITSNNVLSIANIDSGYEFNQDDGTFLFKYVPGDFQASVDLLVYTNGGSQSYNCSGLMARGYTMATNGTLGAPLDQSGNECWIAWERFDEFGIGTRFEQTIDNSTTRPTNPDENGPEHYMLLARVNGTNFFFLQRASTNVPWHATGVGSLSGPNAVGKFAGQPMQVGIMISGFNSGTQVNCGFANYFLDVASAGALSITPATNNVILSWPGSPSVQLQSTPTLNPVSWTPMSTGTAVFTNGQFNLTVPNGPGNLFFRLQD